MDITKFIKQYSFIFILLLFTFLFLGLKLLLNTQDKSMTGNEDIASFTEKNIFYLVLSVFVILIAFYIYNIIKFYNKKPIQKIKPSYQIENVYDSNEPVVIFNKNLDCPNDEGRFSFSLFLNIKDFYCNRGFWKCIFTKGNEIKEPINSCIVSIKQDDAKKCAEHYENLDSYVSGDKSYVEINALKNDYNESYNKLKKIIKEGMPFSLSDSNNSELLQRVNFICNILDDSDKASAEKKQLFKSLGKNYKLFKIDDSDGQQLSEFILDNILRKHQNYCTNVYAIDKKVIRTSQPDLLNKDTRNEEDRIFIDDYDNKCSVDNLKENYPELIPTKEDGDFGINQDIELINLSKENKLQLEKKEHYKDSIDNIEGFYNIPIDVLFKKYDDPADEISSNPSLVLYENVSSKTVLIQNSDGKINIIPADKLESPVKKLTENDIVEIAKKEGLDYIVILDTSKVFKSTDAQNTIDTKTIVKEDDIDYSKIIYLLLDFRKTEQLQQYKKNIKHNSVNTNYASVLVKKILNRKETQLHECWNKILNNFPHQTPGVWLNPFVNDLRICITTYSENKYEDVINDITHAYKFSNKNYYIKQKNIAKALNLEERKKDPTHPDSTDDDNIEICKTVKHHEQDNKYRNMEYFDIENIPIKENFHLGIVLNSKIVDIYLNGKLFRTMKLFGNVKYSNGPLQINTGKNGKIQTKDKKILLGGTINHFKYFPYALRSDNMMNVFNEKSSDIITTPSSLTSHEHNHNIEISHEHEHDIDLETDHKHSVQDEHIPEQYYLDD